jgi:isopentenyl-diphosphate delta-isomerase
VPSEDIDRLADQIEARKAEHLRLGTSDVESHGAGWDDIELVHQALPEVDFDAIDLSTEFLGRSLRAPLMIAGMTGGHRDALGINGTLARAAQRHGLAMGLGSQRAALRVPALAETYAVAREEGPDVFLIGNIGAAQLITQDGDAKPLTLEDVERAIDMIDANALAIHLNFLEEVVQPEGNRRAAGCLLALQSLAGTLQGKTPIIAKETGCGISPVVAKWLADAGVSALDVGGRGGTSFAALEAQRAAAQGDETRARVGELFRDWGIPAAASVLAGRITGLPVIATGGVRSGRDLARAVALGASLVGVARPMLQAAQQGDEAVEKLIEQMLTELRVAMFLTGSATLEGLMRAPRVVIGKTEEWVRQMGLA